VPLILLLPFDVEVLDNFVHLFHKVLVLLSRVAQHTGQIVVLVRQLNVLSLDLPEHFFCVHVLLL
jgi:hypothetical protein